MNYRISISSNKCHGKPVIKGTRVLVSNILGALSTGETIEQIIEDYPNITREDIYTALEFGSELSNFETHSYVLNAIGTYSDEKLNGFAETRKEFNKWQPKEF